VFLDGAGKRLAIEDVTFVCWAGPDINAARVGVQRPVRLRHLRSVIHRRAADVAVGPVLATHATPACGQGIVSIVVLHVHFVAESDGAMPKWICKDQATTPASKRHAARRVAPELACGFVARSVEYRCGYTPSLAPRHRPNWEQRTYAYL